MKRGTPTHTKTRRLCRVLGIKRYEAVGLLEMLWHLTAAERPHGDIGEISDEDIADALDWAGDASVLIAALIDCGWLDNHPKYRLAVHDWHLHADDTTKKRVQRDGNWWASEFVEVCRILSDKKRLPEPEPEPMPEPVPADDHPHMAAMRKWAEADGKPWRDHHESEQFVRWAIQTVPRREWPPDKAAAIPRIIDHHIAKGTPFKGVKYATACIESAMDEWVQSGHPPWERQPRRDQTPIPQPRLIAGRAPS
jgi:hypothetical protein